MEEALNGYENIVQCPYNPSHQIMSFRMQTHLVKCRKNYPEVKLKKCPFSEVHDIPEPEFALHVESCPDRASFDSYKYCISTTASTLAGTERTRMDKLNNDSSTSFVKDEECWDDDHSPAYNPRAYAKGANVIRSVNGMTPSQRKAFREAERQRKRDMD